MMTDTHVEVRKGFVDAICWLASKENRHEDIRRQAREILDTLYKISTARNVKHHTMKCVDCEICGHESEAAQ